MCALQLFLAFPATLTGSMCSGGSGKAGTAAGLEYLLYVWYSSFVYAAYFAVRSEAHPFCHLESHLAGKVTFSHSQIQASKWISILAA